MSSMNTPQDINVDSNHNESKHAKNQNRKMMRTLLTHAIVNEFSDNHQQLHHCSSSSDNAAHGSGSGSGSVPQLIPQNNEVANTSVAATVAQTTTTTTTSLASVRKRLKNETESKDVNNALTHVSIGINCQIGSDFDDEVKHLLMGADLNDDQTRALYNELLRQKQEQEITIASLSEQLHTELTRLESARTLLATIETDCERKIREAKLMNWCSNCRTQIRETERIFDCCYGVLYCSRMCQMIHWRNGHRMNCANNKS